MLDEADALLKPVRRYASEKDRWRRDIHPPVAEAFTNQMFEATGKTLRMIFVSATINANLRSLVHRQGWKYRPEIMRAGGYVEIPSGIQHFYTLCTEYEKFNMLTIVLRGLKCPTLVFAHATAPVDKIVHRLQEAGWRAIALYQYVNDSLEKRKNMLTAFSRGEIEVVVSTEATARGIHFEDLRAVVIMHVPALSATYLHLAGRTGRLGKTGTAVSIISHSEGRRYDSHLTNLQLPANPFPAADAKAVTKDDATTDF